jgi:hypothetical protein
MESVLSKIRATLSEATDWEEKSKMALKEKYVVEPVCRARRGEGGV